MYGPYAPAVKNLKANQQARNETTSTDPAANVQSQTTHGTERRAKESTQPNPTGDTITTESTSNAPQNIYNFIINDKNELIDTVKKVEDLLRNHSARHPVSAFHELESHFSVHIDYQAICNPLAKNSTVHKCIMRATARNCHAYTEVTTENKRDAKRAAACCMINGLLENGIVEMRIPEPGTSQKGWFTTPIYNRIDIVVSRKQRRLSAAKQNFISFGDIKASEEPKPVPLPSTPPPIETERTAAGTELNTNETRTGVRIRPCTPPAPAPTVNASTQTEETRTKCSTTVPPSLYPSLKMTRSCEYLLPIQSGAAVIPNVEDICAPYCNPPLPYSIPTYHAPTMGCAPQLLACNYQQPYYVLINPVQTVPAFVTTANNLQRPSVPVQETKAPDTPVETKEKQPEMVSIEEPALKSCVSPSKIQEPTKMASISTVTAEPPKDQVITDEACDNTDNVKNKEEREPTRKELLELLKWIESGVQELRRIKLKARNGKRKVASDTMETASEQAPQERAINQRNQARKTQAKGSSQVDTKETVSKGIHSLSVQRGPEARPSTERSPNQRPIVNQQHQWTNVNLKGTKQPISGATQLQKDVSGKTEPNPNEKSPIQSAAGPKERKSGNKAVIGKSDGTKMESPKKWNSLKNVEDSQLEQSGEWPTIEESVNQQKQLKTRTIPFNPPCGGSRKIGPRSDTFESDHCERALGERSSIQASINQQQMSKTRIIPLSPAESKRVGARGHRLCNNENDPYDRMPGEWPSIQAAVSQTKVSKLKTGVTRNPMNYGERGNGPYEFRNRNPRAGLDNADSANMGRMAEPNSGDVARTTSVPTNSSFAGRGPLTFADVPVIVKSKEKRVKFKKKKTRCPIEDSTEDRDPIASENAILKSKCLYAGSTEECSSNSSS